MTRISKKSNAYFTITNNQLVRDDRLSWKARGIFVYLWSMSDGWDFRINEVVKHARDGRDSLKAGLKELEDYGYLTRKYRKGDDGRFNGYDWVLADSPADGKPTMKAVENKENQAAGKMGGPKTRRPENPPLSNNKIRNINLRNNKSKNKDDWLNDINLNLLTEKVNEAEQQWGNLTPEIKESLVGLTDQFGQQVVVDGLASFNDNGQHKSGLLKYVKKYIESRRDSNAAQSLKLEASLRKLRR